MKKASPKPLLVGYPVYHAISQLNRSFEEVVESLAQVMNFKLFNVDHLRTYELMVKEVRSLTNQELAEVINDRELESSTYYERLRFELLEDLERNSEASVAHKTAKILASQKRTPRYSRNQRGKTVQR